MLHDDDLHGPDPQQLWQSFLPVRTTFSTLSLSLSKVSFFDLSQETVSCLALYDEE